MKLNTPKEQLALLAAEHAGKVVQIYDDFCNEWEGKNLGVWHFDTCHYRVKPEVRLINGMECPMPLTEFNPPWQVAYVPSFSSLQGCLVVYSNHVSTGYLLSAGMVFETPEDARTVRDALLNYKRGE